jgi:hypothetical protein
MRKTEQDVLNAIRSKSLPRVLRGEECVFLTSANINDDMRPTDHAELLERDLYPLAQMYGVNYVQEQLEQALRDICTEALGVFCAHQCFYIEMVKEREGVSPFSLDREFLPKFLSLAFLLQSSVLHSLELRSGGLVNDRPYKALVSGTRILAKDYAVDWGTTSQ